MVIQTVDKCYEVVLSLEETPQISFFVCREQGQKKEFLIAEIRDEELSHMAIPFFMDMKCKQESDDFVEFFLKESILHLVFLWRSYVPLTLRLDTEEVTVPQRLEMCRSLMKHILAQNLPCYLQYEALRTDNLTVSESDEIWPNYILREMESMDFVHPIHVFDRLSQAIRLLLGEKLRQYEQAEEVLEEFLEQLENGSYENMASAYKAYLDLDPKLRAALAGAEKPTGCLLGLWEIIKKFGRLLFRGFRAAVIVVLLIYLIYTLAAPEKSKGDPIRFDRIGTVTIGTD